MFGSKLRSWMENHIVRPRKRGNKNKHNTGNEATKKEAANQQNGGGNTANIGSLHYNSNGGNNITSPARRREVSPIQNHSRYGWQSPDSEIITSPKSDNFLYAPQQRFRKPQQQQQQQQQTQELHTSEQNNKIHYQNQLETPQQQQQQIQNNSSSSFSSLSWSTGSKEQSHGHIYITEKQTIINERNSQCLQTPPIITFHGPNDNNYNNEIAVDVDDVDDEIDNGDTVHYEEIQTILRQPNNNMPQRNLLQERPKSEQLTSFAAPAYRQQEIFNNYAKDDAISPRYGKLLPSRIQPNGNIRPTLVMGSAESLPNNSYHHQTTQSMVDFNGMQQQQNWHTRKHAGGLTGTTTTKHGKGNIPFHALSSPESAYSTGYSTDGTSPGACHNHPPEYYINMRTGTHYFPKSINSLAIEAQRYKFGLNKIEEMSPIDPLPNVSFTTAANNKMSNSSFYVSPKHSYPSNQTNDIQEKRPIGSHSPLVMRNAIMLPTLHGFESSSPRQRCRIRTNPWYSTGDTVTTGFPTTTTSTTMPLKQSVSTSATSSTLSSSKSSTSTFGQSNILTTSTKGRSSSNNSGVEMHNRKDMYDSSSSDITEDGRHSTLSLTEVEARQRGSSSNNNNNNSSTFRIKREISGAAAAAAFLPLYALNGVMAPVVSDEDATLNEMMGKFDESYIYEKETDILSDSDATNCPSELDTGLDAEDECETDELLDIDFIDTASMKEVHDRKEFCINTANGAYCFTSQDVSSSTATTTTRQSRRNRHNQDLRRESSGDNKLMNRRSGSSGSQHRRKRLIKTRKKNSSECKENVTQPASPMQRSRETRSVGGTPISLRRNATLAKERSLKKVSPMPARASSLIFHHDALMKADLEADVKYRQLIEEAESILVSLKSSTQTIPRETPVSSPRRLNPLVNKRVEMLKTFEGGRQSMPPPPRSTDLETDLNAALNKRIERLKYESSSVPNSPKSAPRFSPSKTHITNFINQIDGQRKPMSTHNTNEQQQQQQQRLAAQRNAHYMDGVNRLSRSPTPTSPLKMSLSQQRQNSAATPATISDFDSDFELENNEAKFLTFDSKAERKLDLANHNFLPEITRVLLRGGAGDTLMDDFRNHNSNACSNAIANNNQQNALPRFCPQSEPLKRKVYKGSNAFERLKLSFEMEAGNLSTRFQQDITTTRNVNSFKPPLLPPPTLSNASSQELSFNQLNSSFNKKQLLLDTLSDLKQNLENQSVELNGLNAN